MTAAPRLHRRALWTLLLVATAAVIAGAGQWSARREATSLVDSTRRAIEVHALGLRGAASRYSYLPFAAAQHPDLVAALTQPGAATRQRANAYLEQVNRRAGSDALYVMASSGETVAASNWNTGQSFVGQNYGHRPYFTDARAGGSGLFYGIGSTTGIPGLFIATPVRQEGVVLGVVAVKVSLREIETAWGRARDPVLLADARGVLFLGSVAPWMFNARRALSAQDLEYIARHEQYGRQRVFAPVPWSVDSPAGERAYLVTTTLGGQTRRFLAVDESLPELSWTLTVMTDQAPVLLARNVTWALGGLGAALLLFATLFAQSQRRRLAEQHRAQAGLEAQVLEKTADLRERTARLQDEQSFRKAMEDALLVGMRARDLEGRIVYVNPALCDITGYAADVLVGALPPYPYWHPDDLEKHWRESDAALSGQAALTGFESRIRHRDGHDVVTMVYTARLIDAAGRHSGWMSSVVDITQQRRNEELLRSQQEQLQRNLRLASLGELATTLGHELNQPLMALSMFASAARAFAQQGNQAMLIANLDDIKGQAQRAADIVQRIRDHVRRRTGGGEPAPAAEGCAMNQLVGNVLALQQAETALRGARVVTRLQSDLPLVAGDRVLLEQVLLNLLQNSLQAMQDMPPERRLVAVETRREGDTVVLQVADRGPGVDPEAAAHLFEPFYTTKPDGLGLGLNICRTIIESHRGRLGFENRPGGGAIFTIQLPAKR